MFGTRGYFGALVNRQKEDCECKFDPERSGRYDSFIGFWYGDALAGFMPLVIGSVFFVRFLRTKRSIAL